MEIHTYNYRRKASYNVELYFESSHKFTRIYAGKVFVSVKGQNKLKVQDGHRMTPRKDNWLETIRFHSVDRLMRKRKRLEKSDIFKTFFYYYLQALCFDLLFDFDCSKCEHVKWSNSNWLISRALVSTSSRALNFANTVSYHFFFLRECLCIFLICP